MNRIYACIDLKSFYASVECVERKLNPLTTNLVVADSSRTEKTICLAVSPSLKSYGLNGRARLFEVISKINKVNHERRKNNSYKKFIGNSHNDLELKRNLNLKIDYIIAPPRMSYYLNYSSNIYKIYLKYLSPDDIFVYSIDEVFCDITNYLKTYNLTARELITKMIHDVYKTTGITATAGIGTNLFLAKVAMDIEAKHTNPDKYGVRIAYLDEMLYKKKLWSHKPLTSFWRVGEGYKKKLEKYNILTMGDIARISIKNEDILYKLFGVNAEILIDHAWGIEPCTIKDIKMYKPKNTSISSGQVLMRPYNYEKARIVISEMADNLSLDLVEKKLKTNKIVINICYDISNLNDTYNGDTQFDYYGRKIPKDSHGTININYHTSSSKTIIRHVQKLFDNIVNKKLKIKKLNICFCDIESEENIKEEIIIEQISLFSNNKNNFNNIIENEKEEAKVQKAIIDIKNKFGKNSIIRAMDLQEDATLIERNNQIGGHRK